LSYPTDRAQRAALVCAVLCVLGVLQPWAAAVAYLALAVLLALAVSDLRSGRGAAAPSVLRRLPRRARIGEPCTFQYDVVSPRSWQLLDELPEVLGGDQRFGPFTGARTLEHTLVPSQRGVHPLGPTYLFVRSPLGLFQRRYRFYADDALSVYPAEVVSDGRGLSSRTLRHELGLRPRRPPGGGAEFESLREYVRDDEPKRIDWRASARARKLMVRNFHVERSHSVMLALDCGRLMGAYVEHSTKLDLALSACMRLTRACSQHGDRVGFMAFDRELRAFVAPQRAAAAASQMLEASLSLVPDARESSYRTLAEVLQQRQKKRALIVVLTDFVEAGSTPELEAYLSTLARRHCVLLVGLRDRLLREVEQAAPEVAGLDVYRRLVLRDLDMSRGAALARITRLGVQTLDLDPAHISAPLLDRYLEIREAGLL
jgi:uncharacterized protein (DUF58 family)